MRLKLNLNSTLTIPVIAAIALIAVTASFMFSLSAAAQGTAPVLEMAAKGTPHALNEAFKRLSKSDGADSEDIDVAIGKSIPHHAHNFLVALKKHRSEVARLDSLLGALGPDYVDAPVKQKAELEKRFKAIKEASSDGLYTIKKECMAELKEQIARDR